MATNSDEPFPSIEIVEEDKQGETIHNVGQAGPHTPVMQTVNVADAYDWQQRANTAEQALAIVHGKFEGERRKVRRLQSRVDEYIEALTRSTQDVTQVMGQCQVVSNTSSALSRELQKAKVMVETLEAVIVLLYTTPKDKDVQDKGRSVRGFQARTP